MAFEIVEHDGMRYCEILWAGTLVDGTTFFSPSSSSLQFGLLSHKAGFVEPAHTHHAVERRITDMQQMFVVQQGVIAVDFFTDKGKKFREVILHAGDAMLLVNGAHAVRVLEDAQCITVKQGPFLGDVKDKVFAPSL